MNIRQRIFHFFSFSTFAIALFVTDAQALDKKTFLQIRDQNQAALVSITTVSSRSMFGSQKEVKSETIGAVIDPSGLTVVAASILDPMSLYADIASQAMKEGGADSAEIDRMKQDNKFLEVKLHLEGGLEFDAELVLTDPEMDLTFLRPLAKPEAPLPTFSHVKLESGISVEVLDSLLMLGRLNENMNREIAAESTAIRAIIKKPRLQYVTSGMGISCLSCAIFTEGGKFIGISHLPKSQLKGATQSVSLPLVAIIPAEEIQSLAKQALSQKQEKKQEPPSD